MRALILSDLHFEFHRDGGASFVESLPVLGVDGVILAGDIAVGTGIPSALALFCERYPQVIYVHGNHEFYHTSRAEVTEATARTADDYSNLCWLDCNAVQFGEVRIHGAPLWFRPAAPELKRGMTDFQVIADFEDWVYAENERAVCYLEQHVRPGDVVITHHLPSQCSVASKYSGSPLNAFFVCDLEPLIRSHRPAVWVHGHTHSSLDYRLGSTRVVCNPFGYARMEENRDFRDNCIIKLG